MTCPALCRGKILPRECLQHIESSLSPKVYSPLRPPIPDISIARHKTTSYWVETPVARTSLRRFRSSRKRWLELNTDSFLHRKLDLFRMNGESQSPPSPAATVYLLYGMTVLWKFNIKLFMAFEVVLELFVCNLPLMGHYHSRIKKIVFC